MIEPMPKIIPNNSIGIPIYRRKNCKKIKDKKVYKKNRSIRFKIFLFTKITTIIMTNKPI